MPLIIPTTDNGSSAFTVRLLDSTYSFKIYWNNTLSMWYLDLFSNVGTPLAQGAALVPEINILRNFPPLTTAFGQLRVVDLTGEGNATPTSMGNTAQLVYFRPGEFEALYPFYDSVTVKPVNYDFDALFTILPTEA